MDLDTTVYISMVGAYPHIFGIHVFPFMVLHSKSPMDD
jgi:hypothetical protein